MPRLLLLAAFIWLTFLLLPVFASQGDTSYPHIAYHVIAIPILIGALVILGRLRAARRTNTQTVFAWILTVTVSLCTLGHIAELVVAVIRFAEDGFANRDTADVWEHGPHLWAANVTIPSTFLSMLVVLALVITAAIQNRHRLESV